MTTKPVLSALLGIALGVCTLPLPAATDTLQHCLRMYNSADTARAVYIYHGVPYAHAARFRAPVAEDGFAEQDTYIHSPVTCYQRLNPATPGIQYGESHVVVSEGEPSPLTENCLVLTVNSPYPIDAAPAAGLPVLVYLHGGNYYAGGGEKSNTQLAELALHEHVVTVSVTYRLGVFGYLYQPDSGSVNIGLQDQLAALRWVHDHIARFGGDAGNITLAGQSAGAQSAVYCLADTARVPVRRALVFSAPMGLTTSAAQAARRTRYVRRYLAERGLDAWTCTADSLLAAQLAYMDSHPQQWHALPFSPAGLSQMPACGTRVQWPEQVVVSVQAQDGSMFGPKIAWGFVTGHVFNLPARRYVRYLRKHGVTAYYNRFTWQPHGSPLQAAHCAELPLFLDDVEGYWTGSWIMGDVTAAEIRRRREGMMDAIGRFMRTGEWRNPEQYDGISDGPSPAKTEKSTGNAFF